MKTPWKSEWNDGKDKVLKDSSVVGVVRRQLVTAPEKEGMLRVKVMETIITANMY